MIKMTSKRLKDKKVPNLRFPEFTEEWETKKLEEICKMQAGKFISASEINDKKDTGLFPCYGGNGLRGYVNLFNRVGMYSLIGRQGALCGNVNLANGKFYATEHAVVAASFENIDTIWMFYLLNFLNLNQYSTGMAQPGLSIQNLEKIETKIPNNIIEQKKIGSLLSVIDERISTQNKIIEELKLLKNTLSKKIFSGQLKFKDKNDNNFLKWESKELAEVMSVPEKTKSKNIDKNRLLTVKLHLKGVSQNDNTNTLSLGATNYFIRKKGQFIYGKQNLFNGAFGIIPDKLDGFLSSGDVPALDIKHSKINTAYLLYFLGRVDFYKRLEDLATGSGSKRVHETTLLGIKIDFPTIEEQHKIASFLLSIDGKIEIETNILQKLERQKTYFLANLFI